VKTSGIVMRPVHDGRTVPIVHHLAAHLDPIARLHRDTRGNADVVHDLHAAGIGLRGERFMFAMRASAEEEARRARNVRVESDFGGTIACICGSKIHVLPSARSRRSAMRKEGRLVVH